MGYKFSVQTAFILKAELLKSIEKRGREKNADGKMQSFYLRDIASSCPINLKK